MNFNERVVQNKARKKLNIIDIKSLSNDIRSEILRVTQKNGGHLASNLGIVETTVALYHIFDFPTDKLVFDVGHQCYAHKLLSDREKEFDSLRQEGGVSGFPDREESVFDPFTSGHAGSSISQSLGLSYARDKKNEDYYVVNVVGDSSLSNGVNLEALFASNVKPKRHIVILNDNGMGISENKNGLYRFISKNTTNKSYVNSKRAIKKMVGNSFVAKFLSKIKNFFKSLLNKNNYFENHGMRYVGVVDGNNIKELVKILTRVKNLARDKCVLLHIKTTKGKGHLEAEKNAELYHGVGKNHSTNCGSFALALGEKVSSLIESDDKVVAITAGMADGTGLSAVEKNHPKNFIDVGIAEEFALTLASGMAVGGLKPIVAIYSTFLQRAYDQLANEICLQNLPVIICVDRAGLVGADGKTHQGIFDLSFTLHLPNLTVLAPNNKNQLNDMLEYALSLNSPVVIRYPKDASEDSESVSVKETPWLPLTNGDKVSILAVGPNMKSLALDVASKVDGVKVVSVRRLKPLDTAVLDEIKDTKIITLEENVVQGGFGGLVSKYYSENSISVKLKNLGVKEQFVKHGTISSQLRESGLTSEEIIKIINNF